MRWPVIVLSILIIAAPAAAQEAVSEDSTSIDEVRNLVDLGLSGRDAWYVRGFDKLFARSDPAESEAARGDGVRVEDTFAPYAGLRIRTVWIVGREAFGTIVDDSTSTAAEAHGDTVVTRTKPFTSLLNVIATQTHPLVLRRFLRFGEGDSIDPFALADSERLLRSQGYVSDAKIEVIPVEGQPGWADVAVLVRDRFPLGIKGNIHTKDRYDAEVFHRNLAGVGLNVEYEITYQRDKTPPEGWRALASRANLLGTFVNLKVEGARDWGFERTEIALDRFAVHPDIRLLGGLNLRKAKDKNHERLPAGVNLDQRVGDVWAGWSFRLGKDGAHRDRRIRLIPALRFRRTDYVEAPREFAVDDRAWRDTDLVLGQVSLTGIDYYTTSLVYGYGETEDIPSGYFASVVTGYETGENGDRTYLGANLLKTGFTPRKRFWAGGIALGGFFDRQRMEDGVLDLFLGGFSRLHRTSYGHWRHFAVVGYTLGLNRNGVGGGLRLDQFALRDLDSTTVAGNQRLTGEVESVLFTRLAILGFKMAAFGYVSGGFVGEESDPIFGRRFATNLGFGLRMNNPRLVIPTAELRIGYLSTEEGREPVITFKMGDIGLFKRDLPSTRPTTLAYK